jgi:hypothetical protein
VKINQCIFEMVIDIITKQLENIKEAHGGFFGNKAHDV